MEPKNFLFVTIEALAVDIAYRVGVQGHNVRMSVESEEDMDVGDGFVEKVSNWEEHKDWADVIVFDDVLGQGKKAVELRSMGKLVVGGTPYTDRLEDEREFGQTELKKMGVHTLPSYDFKTFLEAAEFVKGKPDRYVLKPSGEEAQHLKGLLFISEENDGKDMLQVLQHYHKAWGDRLSSIQLQKRIQGVEVAAGAFFNGKQFVYPINVNFEHKKLFPGNYGPSTGEMGTTMFWSSPNKLFNETLKKFEGILAAEGYVGYIDLNCIVNDKGIYPLEWTARFGYPTIMIQEEGMITPIGDFLYGLASGTLTKFDAKKGFQIGVRLCVPPFPFIDPDTFKAKSKDSVILFKKNHDGAHIEDAKRVNDEWLVGGNSGVVCCVCATGPTMKQAQDSVYHRIRNILIPHMYFRKDIGDRWFEDSDKLHNWGYLREL
ncbi:MAG: phosphoribosylglycinamide synthetase C domain-containing protein [archaeon]